MYTEGNQQESAEALLLRRARLRRTPQRLAIVRALFVHNHATVAEIYDAVRQLFPTIALTTVYATLSMLTERGVIQELPFEHAVRYDVNLSPHANLICTRCDRIVDLADCTEIVAQLRERAAAYLGFQLHQGRIDLFGLCSECQASPSS